MPTTSTMTLKSLAPNDRSALGGDELAQRMMNTYAGIGSRETPASALAEIEVFAMRLAIAGWTLRSGGADGADTAFADGASNGGGQSEIYLPWASFGDGRGILGPALPTWPKAQKIASDFHPAWRHLKFGARALMARNVYQILGANLDAPVDMVLCWAAGSKFDSVGRVVDVAGGTGLGVRLAAEQGIPIYNLALHAHADHIRQWVGAGNSSDLVAPDQAQYDKQNSLLLSGISNRPHGMGR